MFEIKAYKHELEPEKFIQSLQIGYNLAMRSSKEKAKKNLSKYYYKILNIPITPNYSSTQTQMDNRSSKESEEEGEEEARVGE